MKVQCVWEHNGGDTLLYCAGFPGAYARGESRQAALEKLPGEVRSWLSWAGRPGAEEFTFEIVQEKASDLAIRDADSDVLFASEEQPLTREEYEGLKALALRSAADFQTLYDEIPDKGKSCLERRRSFYGDAPRTAEEMYRHTKNVNAYYFGEIDVAADNAGSILECRRRGFAALEAVPGFLEKLPCEGSYGEWWSVRKVLRRFLWHDRIHARAMYRMARRTFPDSPIPDPFRFQN